MSRYTLTEKILLVIEGVLKEQAAIWYPYKGFGKSFFKYKGSFHRAINELTKRGFLEQVEIEGEKYLRATPKGKLKLIKKKIFNKWDGLWRVITFDIDEKKKRTRDLFRSKLRALGCLPVQKSVWITPNDISSELEEIIFLLNIADNVEYFISKTISNDEKFRKMFDINE